MLNLILGIFILIIVIFSINLLHSLLHTFKINKNNYEKFYSLSENEEKLCKNFYNNSQCNIDINKNKCDCTYQKDSIKYSFDSPEFCCKKKCNDIPLEECSPDAKKSIPYYCNIGGECKEYQGTIMNSHISANNCGTDPLNNQLLLPYASLEECTKSVDICDKYNNSQNTPHINKTNCLADVNCGYCTNDEGGGKCIGGTISGPSDLNKYYYCQPYSRTSSNNYEYGNHAQYCL